MTFLKISFLVIGYIFALSARANISEMSTLTYLSVATSSGCANTDRPAGCVGDMSYSYSTLSSGTINESLKEEIKAVETDALEFIAGEPMTLALEEQIKKVRQATSHDLVQASDEEIVLLMIKIAEE